MQTIGERLKGERERLGLSQSDICDLTGVSRKTQFNYESGERHPDAAYLANLLGRGADIVYILSGQRGASNTGHNASGPDSELLAQTIEGVELLLKKMGKKLPSEKKARVIVMLYRSFAASQNQIDLATIREMIELAA